MLVCHQAFYARTDLAKAIPYDLKYHYSADVDWCIKIMKSAASYRLPLVNTHVWINMEPDGGGPHSAVVMHLWFALRGIISRRHTR